MSHITCLHSGIKMTFNLYISGKNTPDQRTDDTVFKITSTTLKSKGRITQTTVINLNVNNEETQWVYSSLN